MIIAKACAHTLITRALVALGAELARPRVALLAARRARAATGGVRVAHRYVEYTPVQIERIDTFYANAVIARENRVRIERSRDEPGVFFVPVNFDRTAHRFSDDRGVNGPRVRTLLRDAAQDARPPFRDRHDKTRAMRNECRA